MRSPNSGVAFVYLADVRSWLRTEVAAPVNEVRSAFESGLSGGHARGLPLPEIAPAFRHSVPTAGDKRRLYPQYNAAAPFVRGGARTTHTP